MFKVGDKVRVKAGVNNPRHGWGRYVKPGDVGFISENNFLSQDSFSVDFPERRDWKAYGPEMELVKDKPKAKKLKPKVEANNPPKKPFTAKDIHNRPVYAQLKASAVDARTLTKLVKAYLVNLNNMPDAENKFAQRTAAVISSFNWAETPEGNAFWSTIAGWPVKFEDIKPKAVKKAAPKPPRQVPAAPVAQPPIGRGERPADATHWTEQAGGRWLKVDAYGVVSYSVGLDGVFSHWIVYRSQQFGDERVEKAVALDVIAKKGAIPEPPAVKKAPRIGWW